MSYNLNPNRIDEMSLQGKFISSGKKWAHVLHGVYNGVAAPVTSQQLLTEAIAEWATGLAPVMAHLSSDVQLNQINLKQVVTWKSRFGRVTQLGITIVGGALTAVVVLDAGTGYSNGTDFATIVDFAHTGTGAAITLTYAGGSCTGAVITDPGAGYSLKTEALAPLPDAIADNRQDVVYGAQDFIGGLSDNGSIATDREPSFNAISIKMRSGFPGRYGRGAAHWPGITEAQTTKDVINAPDLANLQTDANSWFVTPFSGPPIPAGAAWQPFIFSPKLFHSANPLDIGTNIVVSDYASQITTAIVNTNVGTMRRRKLKN